MEEKKVERRKAVLLRMEFDTMAVFEKWCKELGLSKAAFATMCIKLGMKSLKQIHSNPFMQQAFDQERDFEAMTPPEEDELYEDLTEDEN
jgi:hypothetical protein